MVYSVLWYEMRMVVVFLFCFFQAEDGIRDLVRSRGLGDVYKRQTDTWEPLPLDECAPEPLAFASFTAFGDGKSALLLSLIHI